MTDNTRFYLADAPTDLAYHTLLKLSFNDTSGRDRSARLLANVIVSSIKIYTDTIPACHDRVSFSSLGAQLQSRAEPLSFVTPGDESDRIPGCWKK